MPQLAPNFWAANFITIWALLVTITMTMTSLHLPSSPTPSPTLSQQDSPLWPWT